MYELRWRSPQQPDEMLFSRLRTRYRLRYVLNKPAFTSPGAIYLYAYEEIMVNFGSPIVYNMFAQNRLALGGGIRIGHALRLDMRMQRVLRSRATGYEYDQIDNLMVGVFIDRLAWPPGHKHPKG
jgi:hypothetical protein